MDPDRPGHHLRPGMRYLLLHEARALECNGCGDCCDSRRTDGYWTWASLPADGYASECEGVPLIIPLSNAGGTWVDRAHQPSDASEYSGTRFRCSAFQETPPGVVDAQPGGTCLRHDQWRPAACVDFPVGGAVLEEELAAEGEVVLETGAFPRCTWHRVTVVLPGDPRLAEGRPEGAPVQP